RDHIFNPGIDEEYADLFIYGFSLDLNDADPNQPIVVRLQCGDKDGNGWTDCLVEGDTVNTLTYNGTEDTWTGELGYDILPVVLPEGTGMLEQARIVCEYTLTDGTAGTVYSTDIGELYAYKGEFLHGVSAELKDGVLTAVYEIDRDLVLDVSEGKLSLGELTLWSGDGYNDWWDIMDKAEVSPVDENNRITVTYTLDGEALDPLKENELGMALSYSDKDGAIENWQSYDRTNFRIPPVMDLGFDFIEGDVGFGVSAKLTPNCMKGGEAVVTLYRLGADGYEPVEGEEAKYVYKAEDEEEDGTVTAFIIDESLYDHIGSDDPVRYTAKLVLEYTCPDGTTGTLESREFEQYAGNFARFVNDPAFAYDTETQSLVAEIAIDLSMVDLEHLSILETSCWRGWDEIGAPALTDSYDGGDGTWRMVFALPLETLQPEDYMFDVQFLYRNGDNPSWVTECFDYRYLD
ncbi:MAG: hypothetical protein IIZ47_05190, partial [Erysipelotrichaceae bacterium]|nr:hypothetical protein [Erysipelotrichaceae bacterium]